VDIQDRPKRSGSAGGESGGSSSSPPAPTPLLEKDRGEPSRELIEFLTQLATALNKFAIYPLGHPSQAQATAHLPDRLLPLVGDGGTLSVGVARDQLVIGGVATDRKHPLLRDLANRLRRHQLGAISFHTGVEADEMKDVLCALACEPGDGSQPLGLGPLEQLRAWTHVRLYAMTFDRLQLLDERDSKAATSDRGTRAAQLWLGLARAALAADADEDDKLLTDPHVVAKSIDEHPATEGYDQVVIGHFLQIAEELKTPEGGRDAAALRHRISRLLSTVQPETLTRLVEMGGDLAQRRQFVLDASLGMELDAVIDLVRASADASKKTLSDPMIRMLSKLAAHADGGTGSPRSQADVAVREQVQQLVMGWDLADPNPAAYAAALQGLSGHGRLGAHRPEQTTAQTGVGAPEPLRLLQMALEVETIGPSAFEAIDRMVEQGDLASLLHLVSGAPADSAAAEAIWTRIATPDNVRRLLQAKTLDGEALDFMVTRMHVTAVEVLLSELAASTSLATRRFLLERLGRMGPAIGPLVAQHFEDHRWFVQRNMLRLLDDISWWPVGFSAVPFSNHADVRVRREALKLRLKMPAERDQALCGALSEDDEPMLRIALTAALGRCPEQGVALIAQKVTHRRLPAGLSALGIQVLERTRSPLGLEALLQLTVRPKRWWRGKRLAVKSPEMLAALRALAQGWSGHGSVVDVLALAAKSDDPEIRASGTREAPPHE
jgi:hypothetical protein